jgi:hypothetical protein
MTVLAALSLLVAACGDDDDAAETTVAPETTEAMGDEIVVGVSWNR